jgi:hypothetical protein
LLLLFTAFVLTHFKTIKRTEAINHIKFGTILV